jgi:uncharacterized linocin/CFP29 family protein
MADLLKRSIAPLTAEAWQEIDDQAVRGFKALLSARTLVDFSGPHGWEHGAVNLGRLEIPKQGSADVPWGIRKVLPLVEIRIPFVLDQMEIDSISRGCKDPDLSNLDETVRKVALFEESAIYRGFDAGQVKGMIPHSAHKAIGMPKSAEQFPPCVAEGVKSLSQAGVSGPYALVLGTEHYHALMEAGKSGYPPRRIVRDMLKGEIVWSPAVEGGIVLSTRGGDFEMIVGQDLSIGYCSHDRDTVELFLTESFTFRVLEPAAAIELKPTA